MTRRDRLDQWRLGVDILPQNLNPYPGESSDDDDEDDEVNSENEIDSSEEYDEEVDQHDDGIDNLEFEY